jgi:peptide-methionine (S)-S-oxide reductase
VNSQSANGPFSDLRGDVAIFGAGCFWCIDAVMRELTGVVAVESGYSNGATRDPSYEQICQGDTGHAEVVRVVFDPELISFEQLLGVFFAVHDPTTLNRQGNDVGTQYRSGVYTVNAAQGECALSMIAAFTADRVWNDPVVTEVVAAQNYWSAEQYHQDYFKHHPNQGYCAFIVAPKLAKFRKAFAGKLKT